MSLTSELKRTGSPLRTWCQRRLGDTKPLLAELRRDIGLASDLPPSVSGTTMGHAVDVWVKARFDPIGAALPVASSLARADTESDTPYADWLGELTAAPDVLADPPDDHAFAAACLRVGVSEQAFRIGWRKIATGGVVPDPAADPSAVDAVVSHGRRCDDVLPGALPPRPATASPGFSRPGLWAADGDVVVDGTLLEVKATVRPGRGEDLWQLALLALLDDTDQWGLGQVALLLARHSAIAVWDLDRFLTTLAGRPVTRAELAQALPLETSEPFLMPVGYGDREAALAWAASDDAVTFREEDGGAVVYVRARGPVVAQAAAREAGFREYVFAVSTTWEAAEAAGLPRPGA